MIVDAATGEIVHVDPAQAIEAAADPGQFVVVALERGKQWLAEALAHGNLDAIVEAKGWAETLRVATMQKQLGKDAELSATELVRRAERCIGVGIRQGQREGRISTGNTGSHGSPLRSPKEFATKHELQDRPGRAGIYSLTDDVTDEQFENAMDEAKVEGNLSRTNIARKANPRKAAQGTVPGKAPKRSEFHRGTPHVDPARVVEETINTLEGLAMGLDLIAGQVSALDAEKRHEWLEALTVPLSAITRLKKELRG